ncbi:MAG: signal peptidase I [Vampirovibrionales bacterium]
MSVSGFAFRLPIAQKVMDALWAMSGEQVKDTFLLALQLEAHAWERLLKQAKKQDSAMYDILVARQAKVIDTLTEETLEAQQSIHLGFLWLAFLIAPRHLTKQSSLISSLKLPKKRIVKHLKALLLEGAFQQRLVCLEVLRVPLSELKRSLTDALQKVYPQDMFTSKQVLYPEHYLTMLLEQNRRLVESDLKKHLQKAQTQAGSSQQEVFQTMLKLEQTLESILPLGVGVSPEALELVNRKLFPLRWLRRLTFLGRELLEVVVMVLVMLIGIREGIGEFRLIPSESMVPTLQVQDRIFIERFSRWFRQPQRGDILVFYPPSTNVPRDPWHQFLRVVGLSGLLFSKDDNIDVAYIKRLIGLPGDQVNVVPFEGVYINGKKLEEPYVNEIGRACTLAVPTFCEPLTIPTGKYYLLGDNRNYSADSRFWGFASHDRVIGRAVFKIWPLQRIGPLK